MADPSGLIEDVIGRRVAELVGDRPGVVALSGGADSALLAAGAVQVGIGLRAIHVHHGRAASDRLAAAARAVAEQLGLELTIERVSVPDTGSFEAQARDARYGALFSGLDVHEVLLVGHTRDDQAETVLMRLARGAGPAGLAAMRPVSGRVVRPMLGLARADVREAARRRGLPFFDDPANVDPAHTRVVVRTRVLPPLEKAQAGAVAALAAHADLAAEQADHLRGEIGWTVSKGRLSVAVYRSLLPVHQRLALRRLAMQAGAIPPGPEALGRMEAVAAGERASTELGGGFEMVRSAAHLAVMRSCEVPPPASVLRPGATVWGKWHFVLSAHPGRPPAWPVDLDRAVFPPDCQLAVRPLRRDDVIGSDRPMEELAGIAGHDRRCWPVVEADGEPAWVPGARRGRAGWLGDRADSYRWLTADRREDWTSDRS